MTLEWLNISLCAKKKLKMKNVSQKCQAQKKVQLLNDQALILE